MSDSADLSTAQWFKSSYTSGSQACVEVAIATSTVGVRDTKNRNAAMLVFNRDQWATFVGSLKA